MTSRPASSPAPTIVSASSRTSTSSSSAPAHTTCRVVWIQDSGGLDRDTDPWQIVPELRPRDDEPLVHKRYGDSFEDTVVEEVLAEHRVGRLVVTGARADMCVRCTLHGAFVRGYDVTLVGDAHTTEDLSSYGAPPPELVIAHTNLYWDEEAVPGRRGRTVGDECRRFPRQDAGLDAEAPPRVQSFCQTEM